MMFDLVTCSTIDGIIISDNVHHHHQLTNELNLHCLESVMRQRDIDYIRQNLISTTEIKKKKRILIIDNVLLYYMTLSQKRWFDFIVVIDSSDDKLYDINIMRNPEQEQESFMLLLVSNLRMVVPTLLSAFIDILQQADLYETYLLSNSIDCLNNISDLGQVDHMFSCLISNPDYVECFKPSYTLSIDPFDDSAFSLTKTHPVEMYLAKSLEKNEYMIQLVEWKKKKVIPNLSLSSSSSSSNVSMNNQKKIEIRFLSTNQEEMQYLHLVADILNNGVQKSDRTGTGTRSVFGRQMRFSLDNHFPLLTTKKMFWRGIVEELLWFISGSTDATVLSKKGIKIWEGNSSRDFLDKSGFPERKVGDVGPNYSFHWRHYGSKYIDAKTDYKNQGIDQLKKVIEQIKINPNDRRLLVIAWNPTDISLSALPPCHVLFQFYVSNGKLSCQMYQRSCDVALGLGFNIASYSLLTMMVAQICDLQPGELIHVIGDAHIYNTHIEGLLQQLKHVPLPFPTVVLNKNITDIDQFKLEDFTLSNYNSYPSIPMPMSV